MGKLSKILLLVALSIILNHNTPPLAHAKNYFYKKTSHYRALPDEQQAAVDTCQSLVKDNNLFAQCLARIAFKNGGNDRICMVSDYYSSKTAIKCFKELALLYRSTGPDEQELHAIEDCKNNTSLSISSCIGSKAVAFGKKYLCEDAPSKRKCYLQILLHHPEPRYYNEPDYTCWYLWDLKEDSSYCRNIVNSLFSGHLKDKKYAERLGAKRKKVQQCLDQKEAQECLTSLLAPLDKHTQSNISLCEYMVDPDECYRKFAILSNSTKFCFGKSAKNRFECKVDVLQENGFPEIRSLNALTDCHVQTVGIRETLCKNEEN